MAIRKGVRNLDPNEKAINAVLAPTLQVLPHSPLHPENEARAAQRCVDNICDCIEMIIRFDKVRC